MKAWIFVGKLLYVLYLNFHVVLFTSSLRKAPTALCRILNYYFHPHMYYALLELSYSHYLPVMKKSTASRNSMNFRQQLLESRFLIVL